MQDGPPACREVDARRRRRLRTLCMASDFAHELRPHDVAAVALYSGLVRTEAVLDNAAYFDLSNSESPQFVGRVIARLWRDPALMAKSGRVLVAAELARIWHRRYRWP